jgi:hypothetical protein
MGRLEIVACTHYKWIDLLKPEGFSWAGDVSAIPTKRELVKKLILEVGLEEALRQARRI